MADKAKLLTIAQKHLSKGSLDKAIKTFQQLVEVDPRDQRLILRLADIQARAGRKKEAIENYEKVAAGYMKQDFTPKAIAVYKTILRLDPELLSAYEKLAQLYKSQGLEAEALSQFENLFQVYERKNDEDRQIEVLKLMADMDPENLGFQVRLGETLAKKGHKKEAAEAFAKAAATLSRRGFHDRASQLFQKITALNPDNTAVRRELCAHYLESGKFNEAKAEIEAILSIEPDDPRMVLLLGRILFQLGKKSEGEEKIAQSIALFLNAGELESVMREFLFVAQSHLSNGEVDEAEAFYRRIMDNVPGEVRAIKGLVSIAEARKDRVGQIDNLLLLARTMHQGGDREGAVNAYRKVNEIDPLNDEAKGFLERTEPGQVHGENSETSEAIYDEVAEDDNLVEIEALEETEEVELLDVQEIEFEDISVGGVDDEVEVVEVDGPEELESEEALDLEDDEALIEFVEDESVEEAAAESGSLVDDTADDIFLEDTEDDDLVLEISGEMPEDLAPADIPGEPVADESEPQVEEMSLEELLAEVDVYERYGLGEKAVETLERARSMAPQDQRVLDRIAAFESRQQPDVMASTADVPVREVEPVPDTEQDSFTEDLEEADFYHSQGLDDEALRIYKSILTRDPQHQRAMQAIDLIEGKDGDGEPAEPDIPLEIPDDLQPAAPAETSAPINAPIEPTAVNQPPFEGNPGEHQYAAKVDPAPGIEAPVESTPESIPEAGAAAGPSSEPAPGSQFSPESPRELKSKLIVEDSTPEDMGGFLDLADELRSELADEIEIETGSGDMDGPVSFEDIFSQFKKGIEETLGDEEYETHYNLGIAYKDMGLHDDAIREFEAGTRDPELAQDSYSLMAMCYVEKKEYESAVKAIEHALGISNEDSRTGLFYQLGEVREKQKQWSEAASAYEQVQVGDPAFEGIEEAIQRVKASITDTASEEEPEDLSAEDGVDDMLADLIREVEEMAMESSDESPDDPGKIKKDRISYL